MAAISGALEQVLKARRAAFNDAYAQARAGGGGPDAEDVAGFIAGSLDPIAAAFGTIGAPGYADDVEAAYRFALPLVAAGWLGPKARRPELADAWTTLMAASARVLGGRVEHGAASLANALYNLCLAGGGRVAAWTEAMRSAAAVAAGLDELLDAGGVAAWRCGLAQYRSSALARLRELSPRLAAAALRLPGDADTALADRLEASRWHDPLARDGGRGVLSLAGSIGAFRGFGGEFMAPPRLGLLDGRPAATDGDLVWEPHADAFGATLVKVPSAANDVRPAPDDGTVAIDPAGRVRCAGASGEFPSLAGHSSWVADGDVVYVAVPHSFRIAVIAVPAP